MNFASRELSKKLQKMGCVSCANFGWWADQVHLHHEKKDIDEPIFILEDFLGSHPEAIENCKKVWMIEREGYVFRYPDCPICHSPAKLSGGKEDNYIPSKEKDPFFVNPEHSNRIQMLNAKDQWSYLESTMVKK